MYSKQLADPVPIRTCANEMSLDPYKHWLNITTEGRSPNHYELLGIPQFTDDRDMIERQHRKRSREVKRYAMGAYSGQCQDLLEELARAVLCLADHERKREYDRKLGRSPAELLPAERCSMEEVLLAWEAVTPEGLAKAQALAADVGFSLRDALCQCGLVSSELASRALARAEAVPFIEEADLPTSPRFIKRVPSELVLRYRVLPVTIDQGQLIVACSDPNDISFEAPLSFAAGMPVRPAVASPQALWSAIKRCYMEKRVQQKSELQPTTAEDSHPLSGPSSATPTSIKRRAAKPSTPSTSFIIFWSSAAYILERHWLWIPGLFLIVGGLIAAGTYSAKAIFRRVATQQRPGSEGSQPVLTESLDNRPNPAAAAAPGISNPSSDNPQAAGTPNPTLSAAGPPQ